MPVWDSGEETVCLFGGSGVETVCLFGGSGEETVFLFGAEMMKQFASLEAQVERRFEEAHVNRWLEEAQLRGQFEVADAKRLDNKVYNNSKMNIIIDFRIIFPFAVLKRYCDENFKG